MRRMRWLMALLLTLGGIGVLHAALARPAAACSCAAQDDAVLIDAVDVIASATITSVGDRASGDVAYTATIDRVWKGDPATSVVISTSTEDASCGLGRLKQGQELILWGFDEGDRYSMNLCSQPADEDAALQLAVDAFGEPRRATPTPSVTESDIEAPGPSANPAIAAAVFLLAAAGGGLWWASRRRGN